MNAQIRYLLDTVSSNKHELVDLARSPCDDLDGTSVWAVVQKIHCAKSPEEVLPLWRELMRRAAAKGGEEGCLAAGAFVEELLRPLGLAEKIRAANRAAAKGDGEMPERAMSWVDERWAQWTRNLLERGRAQGERRGRAQGAKEGEHRGRLAMLLRFAARKFGPEAVEPLAVVATAGMAPAGLARLGDWIIDCETLEELLARVEDGAAE